MKGLLSAVLVSLSLTVIAGAPSFGAPGNIALQGKASASNIWRDAPDMTPELAIDGKMNTRWGGLARGEWYQIDWDRPQTISGVIIYNYDEVWNRNIPFTLQIWDTSLDSGKGGFKDVQTVVPKTSRVIFTFPPVTTTKLRVNNCITFWELEVYQNLEALKSMLDEINKIHIAAAGDLLGHLIGTISLNEGVEAVKDADVTITGTTPLGSWKETTKTDENGIFSVDLPLGAIGIISISAKSGDQAAKISIDSADIAKRLTPRPSKGKNSLISLEGQWDFKVDPTEDAFTKPENIKWNKISVPSHWEMEGFTSESGKALYQKHFNITEDWNGKRIKFRSEGIYSKCEVWVNGKRVGSHDGGATPFELDITSAAKTGSDNIIQVLISDHSTAGDLDAMSYYAHFSLGGIWRPLEVFSVEPMHISRLALTTNFDKAYRDAELSVDLDIANEQVSPVKDSEIKLNLLDPQGKKIALDGISAKVSLGPWEQRRVSLKANVSSPEQWNAEEPKLYKLIATVQSPGTKPTTIEQVFGFKQVEIKGRTYTINGKPVKFWGVCRHDADPLRGRSITPETAKEDAASPVRA